MALLLSDRNRKVDHGSRVAMPYKTVVLPSGACISPYKNRLYMILKDAVFKKTHVRPSAYIERRTRERRQGANIMNKTSGRIYL